MHLLTKFGNKTGVVVRHKVGFIINMLRVSLGTGATETPSMKTDVNNYSRINAKGTHFAPGEKTFSD